jgi:twitching motility two-component system response regulator PilH
MQTNSALIQATSQAAKPVVTQQVVVVNGTPETFDLLDMLDAGHYDVIFVESSEHAYSQIKRVQPDLVILSVAIDDPAGFRVLSMLNLDEDTRHIPVLTCTTQAQRRTDADEMLDAPDDDMFTVAKPAARMN